MSKDKKIMEMAEVIRRARQELRSGLILPEETATALHNAGYRKESEVAKEFADKLNEKIQLKRDSKEDFMRPNTIKALEFWANEWRNKCIDISKFIKEVAKEYGVEVESES